MPDTRSLLERESRRFTEPSDAFGRLLLRRDRKRRNQRIVAGSVGIAVFVAAVWLVTSGPFDRGQTSVVPGGGITGPTATEPKPLDSEGGFASVPRRQTWHVTPKDIALGDAFMEAWVEGDGEAAAEMFKPGGTFDGYGAEKLPALHDWFRAGGWTFASDGCDRNTATVAAAEDPGLPGFVGCRFTYENDLSGALGLLPAGAEIAVAIDAGRIESASICIGEWHMHFDECFDNMFRSPNPDREDTFGAVWDMFIDSISTRDPDDFERMYDTDRGYPVLDPASIELWERHTHEIVASPQALRRSLSEWMASQSFDVQARRVCAIATEEFWTPRAWRVRERYFSDEPPGNLEDLAALYIGLAQASEETLRELLDLPLTAASRATMDGFVPVAERMIEVYRQQAAAAADGDVARLERLGTTRISLTHSLDALILGCPVGGLPA